MHRYGLNTKQRQRSTARFFGSTRLWGLSIGSRVRVLSKVLIYNLMEP